MIVQESGIEFDFSAAASSEKHDGQKNSVWAGVDFEVQEHNGTWIWLEVKNWEPSNLEPRRRGGVRRSFFASLQSGRLRKTLRDKFIGTAAFLALTDYFPTSNILYVVVLESPRLNSVIKDTTRDHLRSMLRCGTANVPWLLPFEAIVVDVAEWNRYFPQYPARIL